METASKTWTEKFPKFFDYLEASLDGKSFFVGEKLTMAELSVATQMLQVDLVAGLADKAKWPSLVQHTQAMKVHAAFEENLSKCSNFIGTILPKKLHLD